MNRKQWLLVCAALLVVVGAHVGKVAAEDEDESLDEADDYEDEEEIEEEKAILVIWKRLKDDTVVEGKEVEVEITVFNTGASTAGDIQVHDTYPKDMFTLKEGSKVNFRVDKISAGSDASFQYTLIPKATGSVKLDRAKVVYLPSTDGTPQKQNAKSNAATAYVLTTQDNIIRFSLLVGSYATLGALTTGSQWLMFFVLISVVFVLFAVNWAITTMSAARKTHQREKALKDLKSE